MNSSDCFIETKSNPIVFNTYFGQEEDFLQEFFSIISNFDIFYDYLYTETFLVAVYDKKIT